MYIIIINKYTHRIENLTFVRDFKAENHPLIDFIDFLSSKIRRKGDYSIVSRSKRQLEYRTNVYTYIYVYKIRSDGRSDKVVSRGRFASK